MSAASSQPITRNGQGQVSGDVVAGIVGQAASRYGVPQAILSGVFGMESDFGADSATSSTGAMGWMQFEPATARQYGYPMTNNPTTFQAAEQFNAAARYLSALKRQYGTWDLALQHYSGGGYGLSQVIAKSKADSNGSEATPSEGIPGANQFGNDTQQVVKKADSLGSFLGDLSQGSTWLRVAEFIGGIALLIFAAVMFGRVAGFKPSMPARRVPVPVPV